jgi:histidinol-phosphatase
MASDLDFALRLADLADELTMAHYLRDGLRIETKPDLTPVTEADQAVEQAIRNELATAYPQDGIIGEEFDSLDDANARVWVIDPIDATKNYVRGIPVWATLIGLLENGQPTLGVVSAPAMGRRWWASAGAGAFTQDPSGEVRQISVSGVSALSDASLSFSDAIGWDAYPEALTDLQAHTWRARAYGDFLSHVFVAEGAVDIAIEPELNVWDMVAFAAIVQEAGGTVTGLNGEDFITAGNALTTNGLVHAQALALINKK